MCSRYEPSVRFLFVDADGVGVPVDVPPVQPELFPRKTGYFVRRPFAAGAGDEAVPAVEAAAGRWGLVSALTRPDKLKDAEKLSTFNCRSDRVAKSFTFGNAWRKAQRCIVPATAFYEPDWRTGSHIPTRFTAVDGEPLGIAGLWDAYKDASGQRVESYTMMTVNADTHALLRLYHRPQDEKRMLVILPRAQWAEWLDAPVDRAMDFMDLYPADRLVATATAPAARARRAAAPAAIEAPPGQGTLL